MKNLYSGVARLTPPAHQRYLADYVLHDFANPADSSEDYGGAPKYFCNRGRNRGRDRGRIVVAIVV